MSWKKDHSKKYIILFLKEIRKDTPSIKQALGPRKGKQSVKMNMKH